MISAAEKRSAQLSDDIYSKFGDNINRKSAGVGGVNRLSPKSKAPTKSNDQLKVEVSPRLSSSSASRRRPTRPTVRACQERLACKGPRCVAVFDCSQCSSLQCEACETLIHENSRFIFHDRIRLSLPKKEIICQHICETKNLADIFCQQCQKQFCFACEAISHERGKLKSHQRHPFENSSHLLQQDETFYSLTSSFNNKQQPEDFFSFQEDYKTQPHPNDDDDDDDDEKNVDRSLDSFKSLPQSEENKNSLEKVFVTSSPPAAACTHSASSNKISASSVINDKPLNIEHLQSLKSLKLDGKYSLLIEKESFKEIDSSSLKSDDDANLSLLNLSNLEEIERGKMMSMQMLPDVTTVTNQPKLEYENKMENVFKESFLLIDDKEKIQISSEEDFRRALSCQEKTTVKVVAIFGNTGEGKSHTLNQTFFDGRALFQTSSTQVSCTIGVWAAFNSHLKVIVLDTEGLLGLTGNQNQRTRLLLKVLAISDVIIYRTRAERLHNDLFTFLGDASKAYSHHFSRELTAASKRFNFDGPLSSLGPSIVIFHETIHTELLRSNDGKTSAEDILKLRFKDLDLSIDAFSALQYVGTRTAPNRDTNFAGLSLAVKTQLGNSSIRSARTVAVIFKALKVLNEKFNGEIEKTISNTFPDQYFTCNVKCVSCEGRCFGSMNHLRDGTAHDSKSLCRYQHQFDNKRYTCQACYKRGETINVVPKTSSSEENGWFAIAKYAWAGYVLECTNCGVIYRSRQYWYGNKDPWETVVRTEIEHVWPDGNASNQSNQNAAQRVIDGVSYISGAVSSVGAKPAKSITSWVADQIAPSYWIPNYAISNCKACLKDFEALETKHHCRSCGQGFCDDCSSKTKPVPERGWGKTPVRVCDQCFNRDETENDDTDLVAINDDDDAGAVATDGSKRQEIKIRRRGNEETVTVRQVGEVLQSAIGSVASAIDYPLVYLKDTARPSYWVPDERIKDCLVCRRKFSLKVQLHHCRSCGQGVCDACSQNRKVVASRGWDYPVRVCNTCHSRNDH